MIESEVKGVNESRKGKGKEERRAESGEGERRCRTWFL